MSKATKKGRGSTGQEQRETYKRSPAKDRRLILVDALYPPPFAKIDFAGFLAGESEAEREERIRSRPDRLQAAEHEAQRELGEDIYELTEAGEAATFDGLINELDIRERLDAAIARCLKQLLLLRGVKSVSLRVTVEAIASYSPPLPCAIAFLATGVHVVGNPAIVNAAYPRFRLIGQKLRARFPRPRGRDH